MKYITDKDIKNLFIKPAEYVNWVEEALKNKAESILPAKTSLKLKNNIFYNFMPCVLPYLKVAGVKVVNRYPEKTPSLTSNMLLYDLDNGNLKAVFDANYITTMRTGAVAVHSIKCFAKENISTIACIGLGSVMDSTIKILADYFSDKRFLVRLYRYKNSCETFIQANRFENIEYVIVDTLTELFRGADVIISGVTYQENDFAPIDTYSPGCLIIPIHTRGFMNCDCEFDKIFVDDYEHVRDFKYYDHFKICRETAEFVRGECEGRDNNFQKILCYNIGIGIHDVYFAEKFLRMINEDERN